MPGNETEVAIKVRQFSGVDVQTDPAFLPEDVLQASQNLVPQFTYLLQKRYGTTLIPTLTLASSDGLPWASPRVEAMKWTQRTNGTALLFFVVSTNGNSITTVKRDRLFVSVGTPPGPPQELFIFSTSGAHFGMTLLGGNLYVGNGVDPLVSVVLDTLVVTSLIPLGDFTIAGGATVVASTVSTGLTPGTYSYRWTYLDSFGPVGFWRSVTQTNTVVVTGTGVLTGALAVDFLGPTNAEIAAAINPSLLAMDATHTVHLFLSPPGLPIEYARDHGFVASSAAHLVVSAFSDTGDLTPLKGAAFTGQYLIRHRSRVWIAGDQTSGGTNTSKLYSTNTIVPGLEQSLYNWGDFFPALANQLVGGFDGDVITGMAISGGGANKDAQGGPLIVFKKSSMYAFFGDLVDDDTAQLIQISDKFGCIAPQTIVSTPEGIFFLGLDSVYFFSPSFIEPIDIGLPIRPAINAIPAGRLSLACATYHRGFYKLAITPPGGLQNTVQWWLDLRPAIEAGADITSTAKWWGPHQCTPVSTMEVAQLDPAEHERLYVGRECGVTELPATVTICLADQLGIYTDVGPLTVTPNSAIWDVSLWDQAIWSGMQFSALPVVARLRTGGLVENDPFGWKDWTLARIVTRPDSDTPITVTTYLDGGVAQQQPTMNQNPELDRGLPNNLVLAQSGAAIWDQSLWDVGIWGQRVFVEGWSIFEPALRSHSLEIELTHNNPVGLLVRDLEARFAPIERRAPGAR